MQFANVARLQNVLLTSTTHVDHLQGFNGAGTRGNGVPTPFSCFALKWVWSCFKMASFLDPFPHLFC